MNPDFLIIGGGIAGASAGYFLAERGRVAAALATGGDLPSDLIARGLAPSDLLPDRLYAGSP